MKFTCLNKGTSFHFPPSYILDVSGYRILVDCPLDLSALTIFAPLPHHFCPIFDVKSLICAEPLYKTVKNLHLWDASSIDIVLISSKMGMLGLPFLTQSEGFSAKIYATEATARVGQLVMEDLVSMHMEFRQFYGFGESYPEWMKWEELELLPSELKEVALGKDGSELGAWIQLYSSVDVKDCMQKIQMLKYAEAACYNGALVIKAFSSGLEIGSCNWTIEGPKENIACLSSSIFGSTHAMEFDYHSLHGKDLILYSDFSSRNAIEDVEQNDDHSALTNHNLSVLSADVDNWNQLNDCSLTDEETLEERDKLAFICSCVVDAVKAGGSVLIPLNRLGIILHLLEQIPVSLESSALDVPIYVISSVAAELLAFINTIPEWLCKLRQEKLFSGDPLFSHTALMREKKLQVFPAVHSPNLITNWQEPCIVFAPHWNLRLGPVVPLLRRWHKDQNSLLVLEDGLDADLALLPFKPIAMKVLQCSFLSGIRMQKAQSLLKLLQPKIVAFPEDLKQHMSSSNSSQSFLALYYTENERQDVECLKDSSELEISTDLATRLCWRKLKRDDIDVSRLEGELYIHDSKHRLVSGKKASDTFQSRQLLHYGLLDLGKLLITLSKMGINGSVEQSMSEAESNTVGIIKIHHPNEAVIEVGAMNTIVNAPNENLSAIIFEAISTILDAV